MANINLEETQEQARKLLNSKVESVTALVRARQRVTDLKKQLADAERHDKKAYVRATKDGWSTDELRKLGLENGTATKRRNTGQPPKSATGNAGPKESSPDEAQ